MTVSPIRRVRDSNGQKISRRKALERQLRLESLERRELMAADIAPFHNDWIPQDVDGDNRVSPLDALVVINQLNATGPGSLANRTPPQTRTGFIDTDRDNSLSPLDALTIINALNSGEGENVFPLALVKYEFYALNGDGSVGRNLDPDPNDSISKAVVNTGEKFVIRTKMADNRTTPAGVFAAYHDLNFVNNDGSTAEKIELQWAESNALRIGMPDLGGGNIAILSGSFKLQYGAETTATIPIKMKDRPNRPSTTDVPATALAIQQAIEALPSVGAGNVYVEPWTVNVDSSELGYHWDIFFRNQKARTDIPNPTIVDANFTVSSGGAPTPTITGITNPQPSNSDAAFGAMDFTFADLTPAPQPSDFRQGTEGFLANIAGTPGGRKLDSLGGFSSTFSWGSFADQFVSVVDARFLAASSGVINVFGSVTNNPNQPLGISLLGGAQNNYLTSDLISFEPATIEINDALTARNDTAGPIGEQDPATNLIVTSNDTDRDNLNFGIVSVTQPIGGTVTFQAGGLAKSVVYTPDGTFFGQTTFTYTIQNTRGDRSTATVTVDVTPVNDPPVILDVTYDATEDQTLPLVIAPTAIFSPGPANESNQTLTLAIVNGPTADQGIAVINPATGNLGFLPATDFFGTVNITVRGTDSGPNSPAPNVNNTLATLTITVAAVNDAPRIVGTTFSVAEDATVPLSITPSQLFTPGPANESTQKVALSIVTPPLASQGTASIASNGSLQFLPFGNFFGNVVFTVRGTDDGSPVASSDSAITISVTPVNDAPIAVPDVGSGDRFVAIGLTNTSTLLDVMRNDSPGPGEGSIDTIRIKPFTSGATLLGGTVSVNSDRTRVVYTPPATAVNVVDSFTYTIEDSEGLTSFALAEVFVFPPVLPYAIDDSFTVAETATAQTRAFDVLRNDLINAPPATPSLVSIVTQPESGKGTAAVTGPGNASDRVEYTAPAHFFGTAVIKYRMTDSEEDSDPVDAFLTVRVTEVNDPPVASERRDSGREDTVKTITGESITNGLSRGPFEDFQTLTVTKAIVKSGPGTLVLSAGNIVFTPDDDFFGQVVIEYTVEDNGTTNGAPDPLSAVGTLILTIDPVNDNPIPSPKSFGATEDIALPIDINAVIAGDKSGPSNESDQTVSFVNLTGAVTTQRGGTVTQNGNQLLYTPAGDFNGVDTFTYQITDGQTENQFATGTVTINVSEVNDTPVATNIRKKVFAGVVSVIDVSAELAAMSRGAVNESSQTLLLSQLGTPAIGEVRSFNGTQVTYFAPLGTDATTSFEFTVIDNGTTAGVSNPKTSRATFTIEVLPFIPSSLKGIVFVDDDADGVLDRYPNNQPIELPIGGVEVTLSYPDPENSSRTIQVTEMTEADGSYDFELLPPGVYTVSYSTPLMMTNGTNAVMSYTRNIAAPGDFNGRFDFPVLGIIPEYGSQLEYLASSFYNRDGSLRSRGMYVAIKSDGSTDWTSRKDGFEQDRFHEFVMNADGSRGYLTAVRGDGQLYTATLVDRRQYIRMSISGGGQLVRILASSADLTWVPVNPATPPISARGYLETVDDFYRQEGWDWP